MQEPAGDQEQLSLRIQQRRYALNAEQKDQADIYKQRDSEALLLLRSHYYTQATLRPTPRFCIRFQSQILNPKS